MNDWEGTVVYCPVCKEPKKLVKRMDAYYVLTCHTVLRENRGPDPIPN